MCNMNKEDTISLIRSLLSSTKQLYSVYSLNKDFKKETGIDIPLYGYKSLSDFLHSIPQTVRLTGIYPIQQVHLVVHEKSAHIVNLVHRQKKNSKKSSKTMNSSFKHDLSQSNHLQNSLSESAYSKKETFKSRNQNSFVIKKKLNFERPKNFDVAPINISNEIQENILDSNEKIWPIHLHRHVGIGEYVEVCSSKIFNPHKFFLQLRKFKPKLQHLMEQLQIFYSSQKDFLKMTDKSLKVGQFCVAFFEMRHKNGLWLRAEIKGILSNSNVVISLVDYGIKKKIERRNLRHLHRDFSYLPKQAFLASLANIIPSSKSGKWSLLANKRFSNLIFGKDMIAGVVSFNNQFPWTSVALTITNTSEIHVNDTLVNEGFAVFQTSSDSLSNDLPPIDRLVVSKVESDATTESLNESLDAKEEIAINDNPIIFSPKNYRLKRMFHCEN